MSDNRQGPEVKLVMFMSFSGALLSEADGLIQLAEKNEEQQKILLSCSVLVLAAALEDGIQNRIRNLHALGGVLDDDQYSRLMDKGESCRRKAEELVRLSSRGRLELDWRLREVQDLWECNTLRNRMMHINSDVVTLTESELKSPATVMGKTTKFASQLHRPWFSTTVERARLFQAAVKLYFDQVIFVDPEQDLRPGSLLVQAESTI